MKINKFSYKLFIFIVIFLLLGTFYPFVHNYILFQEYKTVVSIIALFLLIISLIISGNKLKINLKKPIVVIITIQLIYFGIYFLIFDSFSYINYIINFTLSIFVLIVISTFNIHHYFVNKFIKINVLSLYTMLLGLILFFNNNKVLSVVKYQAESVIYNFGFFFMKRKDDNILNIRPAGHYDEPGSLAFVILLLLLINHKYLKNNFVKYSLLILPLLTLSLAHFITVYLFFILFEKKKKIILSISTFIVLSLILLSQYSGNNFQTNYIKSKTIGRASAVFSGKTDASRGDFFDGYEILKKNYLGISKRKLFLLYPDYEQNIIWTPLIVNGVFGIFFYYLPFIILFLHLIKTKDFVHIRYLLIISINLLQRPNYIYPIYLILLYYIFIHGPKFKQKKNISYS